MALLQVHEFPDPILQQHAMPVTVFDDKLRQLAADMLETMYEERGIGLAANQVAVLKQIVVVDVMAGDEDHGQREPQVLVNPKIVAASGETAIEEGCLSVPEFRAEVPRAEKIKLNTKIWRGNRRHWKQTDYWLSVYNTSLIIYVDVCSLIISHHSNNEW